MGHVLQTSSPSLLALKPPGTTRNLCCTGHAELHLPARAPRSLGSVTCDDSGYSGCWGLCLWLTMCLSDARATWKTSVVISYIYSYLFLAGMLKLLEEFPWSLDQTRWPKITLLSQGSPHECFPMVPLLLLITKQNPLPRKIGQFSKVTDLFIKLKKLPPKKSTF